MFVRWRRRSSGRLSARLVHNQRVGGRVRQHHVAELGAISPARIEPANTVEGIVARRAFWRTADAALARFSDRIDASLDETIRAALQSRVPVVTPNELRRVSLLKAERERRFWGTMVEVSQRNGQEKQRRSIAAWARSVIPDVWHGSCVSRAGCLDNEVLTWLWIGRFRLTGRAQGFNQSDAAPTSARMLATRCRRVEQL